jgi:hypothetical protein
LEYTKQIKCPPIELVKVLFIRDAPDTKAKKPDTGYQAG